MGDGKAFNDNYDLISSYWSEFGRIDDVKIIKKTTLRKNEKGSLPKFANKSTAYLLQGPEGNLIRLRSFEPSQRNQKRPLYDFDFEGVGHKNKKSGEIFDPEYVHFHKWGIDHKGDWGRSSNAEYLYENDPRFEKEIKLIKKANPNIKFKVKIK